MKYYLILFMLGGTCISTFAQTDLVASGGDGLDVGGSVSFTVGQVFYQQNSSSTAVENQGVQQPYEISVITDVRQNGLSEVELQVYPNPTTDHITILATGELDEELTVQLFDALGQELTSTQLANSGTEIPMHALAAATYFLVIRNNNSEQKTYQIIKR
ncbi:MAG: T9SS type A sorting domain-containing protein [Flavobacteriales bacterium]|nr:T9SS type A sorting domain-containing protein [Flavobacteriales bacterium]